MTREEIARGLRCSASTGDKDCGKCPWGIREEFEGGVWESCDCDRMAVEAADLLENDGSQVLALQRELELKRAQLDCASASAEKLRRQNRELRDAAEREWISVEERMPEDDGDLLAIVSGYPTPNITLENVIVVAAYCGSEGWYVNEYPEWEDPTVTYWMPLPEPPEEGEHG